MSAATALLGRLPLVGGRFRPDAGGDPELRIPDESKLLGVSLFFAIAATNILTPLLPNIKDDFGISIATAGLVVSTYGFARLLTDLPSGVALERIGEQRVALGGIALLLVGSVIGALSPSVEWLIVARISSGLGSGLMTAVILTGLSWTAGARNRGAVMSLFQLANNSGIAIYPLLGGAIGVLLGWRTTFVVCAVGAVVAGAILVPLLGRIEAGRKRDVVAGKVDTLEFELSPRRRRVALGSVYSGVVANMVQRHGIRNTVLPLFAAAVLGLGSLEIASAITLMSVVGIIVVTPGARLGDRIGRRRIVVAGLLVVAVGDLVFTQAASYWLFLVAAAVVGSGDFFSSSQTALLSELVEPRLRARVLTGYRFFVDIGALLGPLVLAAIFDGYGPYAAILTAVAVLVVAAVVNHVGVPGEAGLSRHARTATVGTTPAGASQGGRITQ
ncbi:MAG TPA: MFS transporter [Candidatus Limnocylindrales bacterium]|nr:MFS transporter [Candidatus Limnocylindrales bacterium]